MLHLNGRHTIFGEVIESMEVLDNLTRRDPNVPGQPDGDVMERIDIIEVEE
jgi:peptidylprolyl isomerase/peptidyl-prolyl cis-trans isomerase B (cyclophilin B)